MIFPTKEGTTWRAEVTGAESAAPFSWRSQRSQHMRRMPAASKAAADSRFPSASSRSPPDIKKRAVTV